MSPRPEVREDRACGDTVLADAVDDAPQAGRRDACVCVRLVLLSLVQDPAWSRESKMVGRMS